MNKQELVVAGASVIEWDVHRDARGSQMETFSYENLTALGINGRMFLQGNESISSRLTLRGMHYQVRRPQAKLCWVASGEALDVIADIRTGSPTYGKVALVHLAAGNGRAVYIPRGCAHGFLALSHHQTVFQYLCDAYYDPNDSSGVIWNDPFLNIPWKTTAPVLSNKDRHLRALREIPEKQLPRYEP